MSQVAYTGQITGAVPGDAIATSTVVSTINGARVIDYNTQTFIDIAVGSGLGTGAVTEGLGPQVSFELNGSQMSVAQTVLDAAVMNAATGDQGAIPVYLDPVATQSHAGTVLGTTVGSSTFLFISATHGSGVAAFELDPQSGDLVQVYSVPDTQGTFADGITTMAVVGSGTSQFLYVGSGSEHGITGYEIGVDGSLVSVDSFGQNEGLPVQHISAMDAVRIDGTDYIVTGSAGSSSLTVMKVQIDGTLVVADHLIDGLGTRFDGVTALEAIDVGDHSLVLASGSDMGLSLFTMAPDGRLVHLESLEDTLEFGLDRVTGITAVEVGNVVQVFVTSQGDGDISQFTIDTSNLGDVVQTNGGTVSGTAGDDILMLQNGTGVLFGNAGADVLLDGAGSDRLYGGSGGDVFALMGDGRSDIIEDFEIGIDTLDLTDWPMLYDASQIEVSARANGSLRLTFGAERVDIFSGDGSNLTVDDFDHFDLVLLTRFEIVRGSLPVADPPPDPDPDPEPPNTPPQDEDVTLYGTSGSDSLTGGDGDDEFHAGTGDDVVILGGGSDLVYGAGGIDIVSYEGSATPITLDLSGAENAKGEAVDDDLRNIEGVMGTDLNDRLYGTTGNNVFFGMGGDDRVDGGAGSDTIYGGDGKDGLKGEDGDDLIFGGDGDDNLPGANGNDTVIGGNGNDALGGGFGDDMMFGGVGADRMGGGFGEDYMEGGEGNDLMSGGAETDTVYGGSGNDMTAGSYGSDFMYGGSGNDNMGGGYGHDLIDTGSGNDTVGAGHHHDTIFGRSGHDILNGGGGNDTIYGGSDNDRVNGGQGDDTMSGGSGADTFVFNSFATGERDIITDFEVGIDVLRMARVPGYGEASKMGNLNISQVGGDTLIQWLDHSIVLQDVDADVLTVADFLFV